MRGKPDSRISVHIEPVYSPGDTDLQFGIAKANRKPLHTVRTVWNVTIQFKPHAMASCGRISFLGAIKRRDEAHVEEDNGMARGTRADNSLAPAHEKSHGEDRIVAFVLFRQSALVTSERREDSLRNRPSQARHQQEPGRG